MLWAFLKQAYHLCCMMVEHDQCVRVLLELFLSRDWSVMSAVQLMHGLAPEWSRLLCYLPRRVQPPLFVVRYPLCCAACYGGACMLLRVQLVLFLAVSCPGGRRQGC